jgi:hypothetical protein
MYCVPLTHFLCAEAHRRTSQHNTPLSETSLAEYRSLSVIRSSICRFVLMPHRKASASVFAVSERQALETLGRDEKTASRTLAQLKARNEDMERNREKLRGEEETQRAHKSEVRVFLVRASPSYSLYSKAGRQTSYPPGGPHTVKARVRQPAK